MTDTADEDDEDPAVVNRKQWDALAEIHPDTEFYGVESFLDAESTLRPPERGALGDVAGESLCHLQCHIGLDTLSWARLGAEATGVDYSPVAVEAARDIADRADVDAEFVESDVADAPDVLDGEFDVVVATYGVLTWIEDVGEWAAAAAALLRPGGRFLLVDYHPVADVFDWAFDPTHSYFLDDPRRFDEDGSYADPDAEVGHTVSYQWLHGLGDVLTALADAGLRIDGVTEYPFSYFRMYEAAVEDDDGRYRTPEGEPDLPLLYRIEASQPG
jgi:SAM-dependent methyltransferase